MHLGSCRVYVVPVVSLVRWHGIAALSTPFTALRWGVFVSYFCDHIASISLAEESARALGVLDVDR